MRKKNAPAVVAVPGPEATDGNNGLSETGAPSGPLTQGGLRWKRLLLNLLAGIVAGAIVVVIVGSRLGSQVAQANLTNADYVYLVLAGLCLVVVLLSDAFTLVVISRALCPAASFWGIFWVAFESHLVGGATSFGGLEIPYQVVRLRYSGVSVTQATSVVFGKGMIHTCLLAAVAAGALVPAIGAHLTPLERWVLIGAILGLILVLTIVVLWTHKPVGLGLVPQRVRKYLASFREANLALFHAGWKAAGIAVTLQIVYWVAMFAIIPLILKALGYSGGIFRIIVAQAVLQVVMPFSPLPGGAGIAELGYLGLVGISVPPDIRVSSLVVWRVATWVIPMALGAVVIGVRATGGRKGDARGREVPHEASE